MKRQVIHINEEKCTGCGLCVNACHEGAIVLINGKARLLRDDYCDGMGDCLPHCPADALTFETREALPYDADAVKRYQQLKTQADKGVPAPGASCPGSAVNTASGTAEQPSLLRQWPVQIRLAPVQAPFYQGTDLLVAADCTAYAYAAFHEDFIRDHITLIGCPKLDSTDYSEKLSAILAANDIRSVHIVRMQVPCCGGMTRAAETAIQLSGKAIPRKVTVIGTDGAVFSDT